jgi:hypothetical protein
MIIKLDDLEGQPKQVDLEGRQFILLVLNSEEGTDEKQTVSVWASGNCDDLNSMLGTASTHLDKVGHDEEESKSAGICN